MIKIPKNLKIWLLRLIKITGTILLVGGIGSVALFVYLFYPEYVPWMSQQFDQQKWAQSKLYANDRTRYLMYSDLIHKYNLLGMDKAQILNLLGPQSDTEYFTDWDLRYWLGPEPGPISLDSVWLVISFKDGKVSKYQLITD